MNMNKTPPTQPLLYFIDQYIDDQFMSRSEPFYDKNVCVEFFERLIASCDTGIFYRISVSMSLMDYEHLKLETQKIRIKFVDRNEEAGAFMQSAPSTPSTHSTTDDRPKVFRYDSGFVMLNNRRSRNFIDTHNLMDYFCQIGKGDHFYISKNTIKNYNLNFMGLVKVKNLTEKVANLLP